MKPVIYNYQVTSANGGSVEDLYGTCLTEEDSKWIIILEDGTPRELQKADYASVKIKTFIPFHPKA